MTIIHFITMLLFGTQTICLKQVGPCSFKLMCKGEKDLIELNKELQLKCKQFENEVKALERKFQENSFKSESTGIVSFFLQGSKFLRYFIRN